MRHPLLQSHEDVRKRMMSLLSEGLLVRRAGNLLFVCGGNAPESLRTKFCAFAKVQLSEFQLFQPEYAMKNYFSDGGDKLDLADFETLIGQLSHAIVIFPEGAGSFAETGYFANIENIAQKTILVLDLDEQKNDSFIMMGPAQRYEQKSKFSPNIQINYSNPDFSIIKNRINRISTSETRKFLNPLSLDDPYDIFCLIYKIFDILGIATFDDVVFVLNSITHGHAPIKKARDISSILAGGDYIHEIGQFGHYYASRNHSSLVGLRTGFSDRELSIKLEISEIINDAEPEFAELLKEKSSAA